MVEGRWKMKGEIPGPVKQPWHSCSRPECFDYHDGGGPCDKRLRNEMICPALPPDEWKKENSHLQNNERR